MHRLMCALAALVLSHTAFAEMKNISLEEAIDLALKNNLDVKVAEHDLTAKDASHKRTYSYFFPKIGAEIRGEQYTSETNNLNGSSSGLYANWNLFNGFRDWNERKYKKLEFDQNQIVREKQFLITKTNTESKFYKLLSIIELIKLHEEAIRRNQTQKESALKRKGAGLASESDVLEFEIYQTELQAELSLLASQHTAAQSEFREAIGQTQSNIEYNPNGKLIHFHVDDTLDSLKNRITIENQNIIVARVDREKAELSQKITRGAYLPQLDLRATYGSRGIKETKEIPETTILGTLKWEFFSGFDTHYSSVEATALASKTEAQLKKIEQSTAAQFEIAYTKLKEIQNRVDLESENKIRAQKFFDVVASEYKRGVKSSADLRAAAILLLEVLSRDIQSRADFFEQKATLENTIGGPIKISKGSLSGHTD